MKTCFVCGKGRHLAKECHYRVVNRQAPPVKGNKFQPNPVVKQNAYFRKPRVSVQRVTDTQGFKVNMTGSHSNDLETVKRKLNFQKSKSVESSKNLNSNCSTPKSAISNFTNARQTWKHKTQQTESVLTNDSVKDGKDMSWQEVTYVDAQGNPKTFMTWVPMSN